MAFITKIETASALQNVFAEYGRDSYEDFTYEGLIEYTESCGDMELDVIAICCDLMEDTFENVADNYSELSCLIQEYREENEYTDTDFNGEMNSIVLDYLNDNTVVLGNNNESVSYFCF